MYTPGTLILNGAYRIEAELGHGAFGVVYRATHLGLNVPRAIKTLRHAAPGVGSTLFSDYRNRFTLEARLAAGLTHANVIQVYDFHEQDGVLFCVMEYAPGGSLADLLAQKTPIAIARVVTYLREAALGLQAIHDELDAVHRDVKPSNLLLDRQGHLKVADLGLAQVGGLSISQRSLVGSMTPPHPGTPNYTSPEHNNGAEPLAPTADVYGLGCVAFELLTGQAWKSARRKVRKAGDLRTDTPQWLDALVSRMLLESPGVTLDDAENPAKRCVDMQGVLEPIAVQEAAAHAEAQRLAQAEAQRRAEAAAVEKARVEAELRRKEAERAEAQRKAEEEARARAEAAAVEKERIAAELRRKEAVRIEVERKAQLEARTRAEAAAAEKERVAAEVRRKEAERAEARRKVQAEALRLDEEVAAALAEEQRKQEAEAAAAEKARADALEREALEAEREPQEFRGSSDYAATDSFDPLDRNWGGEQAQRRARDQKNKNRNRLLFLGLLAAGCTLLYVNWDHLKYWNATSMLAPLHDDPAAAILIPAGPFQMGCDSDVDSCYDDDELLHSVTLNPYLIDKYEVTNARYAACVDAGSCTPPHSVSSLLHDPYYGSAKFANFPVINVDWSQAKAFCAWAGGRLPTEAEWEKVARGSGSRIYLWGNDRPDATLLNFDWNVGDTTVVGSYPSGASLYGVMNLSGNVWEWVNDWWDGSYYSTSPAANPVGPATGSKPGRRGGAWADGSNAVRISDRANDEPDYWATDIGFRCVRSQ